MQAGAKANQGPKKLILSDNHPRKVDSLQMTVLMQLKGQIKSRQIDLANWPRGVLILGGRSVNKHVNGLVILQPTENLQEELKTW